MSSMFLGQKLYRTKTINKIAQKIKFLGQKKPITVYEFLNIRLFLTIIIFVVSLFIPKFGFIIGFIVAAIFYKGYEIILLDYPIKKRSERFEYEAIFFLEVLDAVLKTNNDFLTSISLTSQNTNIELALIIKRNLQILKQDGDLDKLLLELKSSIPNSMVANVFLHLFRLNNTISNWDGIIFEQIKRIKDKQVIERRQLLNKMPLKIIILSVIFIGILIGILYFGPIYIKTILN